jgi:hypothetical protein
MVLYYLCRLVMNCEKNSFVVEGIWALEVTLQEEVGFFSLPRAG